MIPKPRSASPTTTLRPPRPALVACGSLALAAVSVLAGFAIGAPRVGTFTVAGLLLVVGVLWAQRGWQDLRNRRRTADRWLLWGAEARPASELLTWRAAELTGPRSRKILSGNLRRLGREAEGQVVPGALPLNRLEIRSQIGLMRARSVPRRHQPARHATRRPAGRTHPDRAWEPALRTRAKRPARADAERGLRGARAAPREPNHRFPTRGRHSAWS